MTERDVWWGKNREAKDRGKKEANEKGSIYKDIG